MMQYVAGVFLLAAVTAGGYGMWMKIQVEQLVAVNQRITIEKDTALATVATQETRLDVQAVQVHAFQEKIAQMATERAAALKQVEYTRDLFNDGRFAKLVEANPSLITLRMEKASAKVLGDLTAASAQ